MRIVPYLRLPGRARRIRSTSRSDIVQVAANLSDDFEMIYVADEDGIARNKPQLDVVRGICDEVPTIYEAGVRFAQNVIDVFVTGADKAVVSTSTLISLDELRRAFKLSEDITFKADFRDGIVAFDDRIAGRAFHDLAQEVADIGVNDVLVPAGLAEEASAVKSRLGLKLGILAQAEDRSRLSALGPDYVVTEDYRSLMGDE